MSKEAMKLALEALENAQANFGEWWPEAIAALREAQAEQPAQGCDYCNHPQYAGTQCKNCGREQPAQQDDWKDRLIAQYQETILWQAKRIAELREQPAQSSKPWVGLTDEQIDSIVAMSCKKDSSHLDAARVARAIEAKLKEKNT